MSKHSSFRPIEVVIDTQTVLDWCYFCDAACQDWPVPAAAWRWLATAAMRDELAHVLARGLPGRRATPATQVLAFFDRHATLVEPPAINAALARTLRCSDPDDQKFIDLALARRPAWLVSRDRAVLKLARRAALHGVQVLPPGRWAPPGVTAAAGGAAIPAPPAAG